MFRWGIIYSIGRQRRRTEVESQTPPPTYKTLIVKTFSVCYLQYWFSYSYVTIWFTDG